eukprot:5914718-Prymnesium_polylepis.1
MRSSQPIGVAQLSSHASSACAVTCDCTNTLERSGSIPLARYSAAVRYVSFVSSLGVCGAVIACRSTTQK